MLRAMRTLILACGVVWALGGCDEGETESPTTEPEGTVEAEAEPEVEEPETEAEAEAAPAGPVATDDETYTVTARANEGGYDQGALGSFGIQIEAQGEWHLNDQFPFSLHVEAPEALALPNAQLAQSDAASWEEMDARFDVPFTASSAGEHEVRATVRFAVCNPRTCVPKTAQLALAVPVH